MKDHYTSLQLYKWWPAIQMCRHFRWFQLKTLRVVIKFSQDSSCCFDFDFQNGVKFHVVRARAFCIGAPSCLCSRLIIFLYFKWFYYFIAKVGWKRLALVRIESSAKMSRLLDNPSLAARVSQPSSVVSNKSHISLMLPTLRRMLASKKAMDELYDMIEKAPKLLTSSQVKRVGNCNCSWNARCLAVSDFCAAWHSMSIQNDQ